MEAVLRILKLKSFKSALLRSLNKYNPELYIRDLFPYLLKSVVGIVDGLRSKLIKEALILLFETLKHNTF